MTTRSELTSVTERQAGASQAEWLQARQPAVAYGSRARHCLRGRWFSLVPVSFSAMVRLSAAICLLVAGLVVGHVMTVRWPALADHPHFIAVFRMDAAGSLARYFTLVLLLVMAGVAHLIYQLRGHRNDDFRGHYRLWRWVTICCLVGSVASSVPLTAMAGGLLDWLTGRRVALSGHDWIRLLIQLGGIVLAVRTLVELGWRRWASAWMAMGWLTIGLPAAAHWDFWSIENLFRWTMVTAAPTIATACWFLSMTLYLRTLYSEVRGLTPAVSRWEAFRARLVDTARRTTEPSKGRDQPKSDQSKSDQPNSGKVKKREPDTDEAEEKATRRFFQKRRSKETSDEKAPDDSKDFVSTRWKRRLSKLKPSRPSIATLWPSRKDRIESDGAQSDEKESSSKQASHPVSEAKPQLNRGKSAAPLKPPATDQSDEDAATRDGDQESNDSPRRRLRLRIPRLNVRWLTKRRSKSDTTEHDEEPRSEKPTDGESDQSKRAKKTSAPEAGGRGTPDGSRENQSTGGGDAAGGTDEPNLDEEEIDWSSLSKAERRRMRKQLRRSGRAA